MNSYIRRANVAANLDKDDRSKMSRWMKGKTRCRRCRMRRCNTNTFTDRDLYPKTLAHTQSSTHRHFQHTHTHTHLHTAAFMHSNANAFTHSNGFTQRLLHIDAHAHRSLHTVCVEKCLCVKASVSVKGSLCKGACV